jgi:hypothetical protein
MRFVWKIEPLAGTPPRSLPISIWARELSGHVGHL